MGDTENSGYQPPEATEQNQLADEISQRASTASEKVRKRVEERIVPQIKEMGDYCEAWLNGMQNDFYNLARNPNDPSGGGNYQGWSPNEIGELYGVLYNEELD